MAVMTRVQTGCPNCHKCNASPVEVGIRNTGRATTAVVTLGMSEAAMAFMPKCRACGHQKSLHGIHQVQHVQPTHAPTPPSTPPPGWYRDAQGAMRWWDGYRWTEHTQP